MLRSPLLLAWLLLGTLVLIGDSATPPGGTSQHGRWLYIVLREDAIRSVGTKMGVEIADTVNTYKIPDQSGSAPGGITYSFSNIKMDMVLGDFAYSSKPPMFSTGWQSLNFVMVFNYHICKHVLETDKRGASVNICEDGNVEIFTIGGHTTKLTVDALVDVEGEKINVVGKAATLSFASGSIEISVHCSNFICAIPVGDISQAIAQQFVSHFESACLDGFNLVAEKYFNNVATTIPLGHYNLAMMLKGQWYETNNNLVFVSNGLVANEKAGSPLPPFKPTISPPDALFSKPPGEISFVYSAVPIASGLENFFSRTITQADLGPNAPISLSTNSFAMILLAPGLSKYPNMNITVTTALMGDISPVIDKTGVSFHAKASATFSLSNSTYKHDGWTSLIRSSQTSVAVNNVPANHIHVNATFANFTTTFTTAKSAVGSIENGALGPIIDLALGYEAKPLSFVFPAIPHFTIKDSRSVSQSSYGYFSSDFDFAAPPGATCGTFQCPLQTTCCSHWTTPGCCQLPGAECCQGSGCCPSGTRCIGNGECEVV